LRGRARYWSRKHWGEQQDDFCSHLQ